MSTPPCPTKKYHKTAYPSIDPTRPELSAKGKTIIITGGGTGIGAEVAKYFAKAGASRIAILGRRKQLLLDNKARIDVEFPDTEIIAIASDVTKKNEVDAAFAEIAGKGNGKIDVLISNAGVFGAQGSIADIIVEDFLSGIVHNLQANFNVAQTFLNYASKNAIIIDNNSCAAHLTLTTGFIAYNTSKAATARFYSALAFENPELCIFSIHPGSVETDMTRGAGFVKRDEGGETIWEGGKKSVLGDFDDVSLSASFMVWLASPEARFLKGKFLWANWDVDELKARVEEIESGHLLSLGLVGWPFE